MGSYKLESGKLFINAPASTRMACAAPERAKLEADYLRGLTIIDTFTLDSGGAPRHLTFNLRGGDDVFALKTGSGHAYNGAARPWRVAWGQGIPCIPGDPHVIYRFLALASAVRPVRRPGRLRIASPAGRRRAGSSLPARLGVGHPGADQLGPRTLDPAGRRFAHHSASVHEFPSANRHLHP
ncbi:hypothetical protein G6F65_019293 [Rhizopus arrhizus]|nr:hypothetical protein G6F65_019293 [Rhizopus arrhizus]